MCQLYLVAVQYCTLTKLTTVSNAVLAVYQQDHSTLRNVLNRAFAMGLRMRQVLQVYVLLVI
jgi:hypothetical protein